MAGYLMKKGRDILFKLIVLFILVGVLFGCGGADNTLTREVPGTIVAEPPVAEPPIHEPVIFSEDPLGMVQLVDLTARENFRNTSVNFSLDLILINNTANRLNVGTDLYGLDNSGNVVFSREMTFAVDPNKSQNLSISYGEPLTVQEYDSIVEWGASPLTASL